MNEIGGRDIFFFGIGAILGAALSVIYAVPSYIPLAAALGVLCFGCGAVLMIFLNLREKSKEWDGKMDKLLAQEAESYNRWKKECEELEDDRKQFEAEKEEWEEGKE